MSDTHKFSDISNSIANEQRKRVIDALSDMYNTYVHEMPVDDEKKEALTEKMMHGNAFLRVQIDMHIKDSMNMDFYVVDYEDGKPGECHKLMSFNTRDKCGDENADKQEKTA